MEALDDPRLDRGGRPLSESEIEWTGPNFCVDGVLSEFESAVMTEAMIAVRESGYDSMELPRVLAALPHGHSTRRAWVDRSMAEIRQATAREDISKLTVHLAALEVLNEAAEDAIFDLPFRDGGDE
jgi:hypothetical protein